MNQILSWIKEGTLFKFLWNASELWRDAFVANYVLIVVAATIFWAIQMLVKIYLPRLFPNATKMIVKEFQTQEEALDDISTRVVAFVHAVYVTTGAFYVFCTAERSLILDYYSNHAVAQHIFGVATGYFLWDVWVCVRLRWGAVYVFHAIAGLLVFLGGMHPFLHYYGSVFLVFELSTPFLHVRKILYYLGKAHTSAFFISSVLFALAFFVARIAIGLPASAMFWWDMIEHIRSGLSRNNSCIVVFLLTNVFLNCLNIYWFIFILKSILKRRADPEKLDKENTPM